MKNIHSIEFYTGSKEELLPGFEKDFPYIASRAELDKYIGHYVPWHWHKTVELFYMESGSIEYDTPGGKLLFPAGSGGIVNSNVLHMTKAISQKEKNIQLLHIFDVSLLAGEQGSRIEQKYIAPIITAPALLSAGICSPCYRRKYVYDCPCPRRFCRCLSSFLTVTEFGQKQVRTS